MRPYLSLDLETTGLDTEKAEILELGFVYDDGVSPIDKLVKYNFILDLKEIGYALFSALHMNARLIKAIHNGEGITTRSAFIGLEHVLGIASQGAMDYDEAHGRKPSERICLAGKNVASFDLPIIKSFLKRQGLPLELQLIERHLQHRVLDPGSMYAAEFGYVPSLGEIMKKIDRHYEDVSHIAVEDAMDAVKAIRHKEGMLHHLGSGAV